MWRAAQGHERRETAFIGAATTVTSVFILFLVLILVLFFFFLLYHFFFFPHYIFLTLVGSLLGCSPSQFLPGKSPGNIFLSLWPSLLPVLRSKSSYPAKETTSPKPPRGLHRHNKSFWSQAAWAGLTARPLNYAIPLFPL